MGAGGWAERTEQNGALAAWLASHILLMKIFICAFWLSSEFFATEKVES